MTNVAIFTPTTDFISDDTTKKMASYVKAKYQELYSNVHWSKAPILETVCYHEAKNILNCIHVPSDAFKMNKAFLEAIILMGFDFLEEFQVEAWESMLLDLPLSKVDQLLTVEEITE